MFHTVLASAQCVREPLMHDHGLYRSHQFTAHLLCHSSEDIRHEHFLFDRTDFSNKFQRNPNRICQDERTRLIFNAARNVWLCSKWLSNARLRTDALVLGTRTICRLRCDTPPPTFCMMVKRSFIDNVVA